ncbi:MAG: LpxD N-terminal domain-containing protein, partial [Panacibacter sp.]
MKFPQIVTIAWIADLINAEVIGDASMIAYGINEIHKVETGDLCFVDHPKYYNTCLGSAATHVIINNKDVTLPAGKTLLVVNEPFEAYLTIVNYFRPFTAAAKPVSDTATIGEGTVIMPNVFIGKDVKIGNNCIIYPNVSLLDYTEIGNNVVIQAGSVIGSDAFYYNTKKNRAVWYKRMQSCGNVIIEDDVEIGAG